MKGKTTITRKTQSQETNPTNVSRRTKIETTTQNNPSGQASSSTTTEKTTTTSNQKKESNAPYKIIIKTIYEKGYNKESDQLKDEPETQNKKH